MATSLIRPVAVNVNTGAVTYEGAITTSEITDETITTSDILDGTITTSDISTASFDARYLKVSNNLSDVTASSARSNLGLGSLATLSAVASAQITDGTITTSDISTASFDARYVQVGTVPTTLGRTTYNPGTITAVATSSTSYVNVDATNLTMTFTVPASGSVRLVLIGWAQITSANEYVGWGVIAGGSLVTGSDATVIRGTATNDEGRCVHEAIITGLTPGSVTWTWAHKSQTGTSVKTTAGGVIGQSIMEALSVESVG